MAKYQKLEKLKKNVVGSIIFCFTFYYDVQGVELLVFLSLWVLEGFSPIKDKCI